MPLFARRRPAPPALPHWSPIKGNGGQLIADSFGLYERCEREYYGITRLRLWHKPVYIVTDPALIEDILVTRNKLFEKGLGLVELKVLFGEGLFTSDHEIWRT